MLKSARAARTRGEGDEAQGLQNANLTDSYGRERLSDRATGQPDAGAVHWYATAGYNGWYESVYQYMYNPPTPPPASQVSLLLGLGYLRASEQPASEP